MHIFKNKDLAQDAIEELNRTICTLKLGTIVTVVYYCRYREEYCRVTGMVSPIENLWDIYKLGNIYKDAPDIFQEFF